MKMRYRYGDPFFFGMASMYKFAPELRLAKGGVQVIIVKLFFSQIPDSGYRDRIEIKFRVSSSKRSKWRTVHHSMAFNRSSTTANGARQRRRVWSDHTRRTPVAIRTPISFADGVVAHADGVDEVKTLSDLHRVGPCV